MITYDHKGFAPLAPWQWFCRIQDAYCVRVLPRWLGDHVVFITWETGLTFRKVVWLSIHDGYAGLKAYLRWRLGRSGEYAEQDYDWAMETWAHVRERWAYWRTEVAARRWKRRWPHHCRACLGAGGHTYWDNHGVPGPSEQVQEACEALPDGQCHRCGAPQGLNEDGNGPCKVCGWDFDDQCPSYY